MTKKQICRGLAFLLVVCCVLTLLSDLFELENDTYYDQQLYTYRTLEADTIDAVMLGTSGINCYYIAPKAFEEHGLSVSTLGVDAMPSWLYINMIEYVYEHQNPELIIIDSRAFCQSNTDDAVVDARARRVIDAMNFLSPARIKAAFKSMETIHKISDENSRFNLSFLLPYIKFHTKWEDEDYSFEKNLGNKHQIYGGFYMDSKNSVKKSKQKPIVYDTELYKDLDPIAEESLYEFLDYVEEKNLNVMFLDTPHFKTELEMGRANTLYKILKEQDVKFINYCETDDKGNFLYDLNLDSDTEFYNDSHVNYYGAEKFTEVFSQYLLENYDLPDRRNDKKATEYWTGIYSEIKKTIKEWDK